MNFLSWQDNLSRGNLGAVKILQDLFPEPGRLQFIYADLGDAKSVSLCWLFDIFCLVKFLVKQASVDVVMLP